MLHYIFVIQNSTDASGYDHAAGNDNIIPSFLLDAGSTNQLTQLYQYCSETNLPAFSVSIKVDAPMPDEFVQRLLALFFIPSYCKIGNNRVLSLLGDNAAFTKEAEDRIRQQANAQGLVKLFIHSLARYTNNSQASAPNPSQAGYLFSDVATLTKHYTAVMNSHEPYNHLLFLQSPAGAGLHELTAAIEAADEALQHAQPALYAMAAGMRRLAMENNDLQRKYLAVGNELTNYKSHLEILRSGHQAKELQDYYNNEYEILPTWFKRLGHIVKVGIGKRSFRSLFNDQVKKYNH